MKIEFVNHSSYVLEYDCVRLICDPWIDGRAFNNGWDLLCETQFSYEDFKNITHIWFSHEHPDHFSPPNIRKIPEEYRKKIVVLYHETPDKKVVNYCRKAGFKDVVELSPNTPLPLLPDLQVTCNPWSDGDSYLHVKGGDTVVLNVNDCIILTEEETRVAADQIGHVDILLTQFSLSCWEGNEEDVARRETGAQVMMQRMIRQANAFKAKYVIPFASYVWFCHEENYYINASHNGIEEVERALREKTTATPIVMYPADTWNVGEDYDNTPSISRYVAEVDSLEGREKFHSPSIPQDQLVEEGKGFIKKLTADAGMLRVRISFARLTYAHRQAAATSVREKAANLLKLFLLQTEPARLYLQDLDRAYDFDLVNGLAPKDREKSRCDIVLGSDSLSYAFKNLFGGESLLVNGRFSEVYPGGRSTLFDYFNVAAGQNRGDPMTWKSVPKKAMLALFGKRQSRAELDTPYDFL